MTRFGYEPSLEECLLEEEEAIVRAQWQGVLIAWIVEARYWSEDGRVDVRDLFRAKLEKYERWLAESRA